MSKKNKVEKVEETEVVEKEVMSPQKEAYANLIARYKESNPEKYEQKKEVLLARLASL